MVTTWVSSRKLASLVLLVSTVLLTAHLFRCPVALHPVAGGPPTPLMSLLGFVMLSAAIVTTSVKPLICRFLSAFLSLQLVVTFTLMFMEPLVDYAIGVHALFLSGPRVPGVWAVHAGVSSMATSSLLVLGGLWVAASELLCEMNRWRWWLQSAVSGLMGGAGLTSLAGTLLEVPTLAFYIPPHSSGVSAVVAVLCMLSGAAICTVRPRG